MGVKSVKFCPKTTKSLRVYKYKNFIENGQFLTLLTPIDKRLNKSKKRY